MDRCPTAGIRSAPRGRTLRGPLLASAVGFMALFTLTTTGQSVQAEAPWLTVYDQAGRPKWEVRMEALVRTADGWEGQEVQVQLYHEGVPHLVLRAPHIRADRYGREWTLGADEPSTDGPVRGEGEGFSFTCREARWEAGLVLRDLHAAGRGVVLSAGEARWELGHAVLLADAEAAFVGWELKFASGRYEFASDRLVAGAATVTGHGVTVVGATLTAWPGEGRLRLTEAHLVQVP
ncbi:MAG TPA: hypothetical protein ENN53_05500 [Candidatus Acetothermia bacterium]|nr:hypothetical protein [Candidatus Acetothermia bacterium]